MSLTIDDLLSIRDVEAVQVFQVIDWKNGYRMFTNVLCPCCGIPFTIVLVIVHELPMFWTDWHCQFPIGNVACPGLHKGHRHKVGCELEALAIAPVLVDILSCTLEVSKTVAVVVPSEGKVRKRRSANKMWVDMNAMRKRMSTVSLTAAIKIMNIVKLRDGTCAFSTTLHSPGFDKYVYTFTRREGTAAHIPGVIVAKKRFAVIARQDR